MACKVWLALGFNGNSLSGLSNIAADVRIEYYQSQLLRFVWLIGSKSGFYIQTRDDNPAINAIELSSTISRMA